MCVGITCGQCKDNLRKSFFPFGLGLTKNNKENLCTLCTALTDKRQRESDACCQDCHYYPEK